MKILRAILLSTLTCIGFSSSSFTWNTLKSEQDVKHSDKCPNECKTCKEAIKKALDYLSSKINDEGCITGKTLIPYKLFDKYIGNVMTTSIAGMAFIANGSTTTAGDYKEHVTKIRDYLENALSEILKSNKVGPGGGPPYCVALSLMFFANLYEKEKDEKSKKIIPELIEYITNSIGNEVSVSTWYGRTKPGEKAGNGKKDSTKIWFISGATALLNSCIISLGRAKSLGFEVKDKPFEVAKDYYATYVVKEGKYIGSIKYDQHNHFPKEPRRGRTIASILALKTLGIDADEKFKIVFEYARKNHDKTGTHHTPSLHTMLGGFTFYTLGKDDWSKFVDANFSKLIAHQKEDGSLSNLWDYKELKFQQPEQVMKPNDTGIGTNYATAIFALILQIPTENVKLFK